MAIGEVGPARHLVLSGLAPGELAAAVRMATGSAVPDALLEGLHARTAGNPYFAAETVRLLRAEGRLLSAAALGIAGGQGGFEVDPRDPDRVTVLTEALKAQPDRDSRTRAALLGRLSLALAFTVTGPERREALSAEAVAMARRLGDPAGLAAALAARCDAISGPDHVTERRAAAAEIVELARASGDSAREVEFLMGYYPVLDRTARGRDEGDAFQTWIRRHDEYA